ncbi:MAG: hypothetical protein ABIH63_00835 [archaeon]
MAPFNFSEIVQFPQLSFSELTNITLPEYWEIVKPVFFFVLGITFYALFIFHFYRFIARRDVLGLSLQDISSSFEGVVSKMIKGIFYILENLILTPIVVFFWFMVFTLLMVILTKNPSANNILITSVALVAAIRVSAYYHENLSQDLAKMLPFALLGIFLVDASFFSLQTSIEVAKEIPTLWKLLVYYLVFVITLEFVLRITHTISRIFIRRDDEVSLNQPGAQE